MWNPDQVFVAEQARRAELYVEAERWRLDRSDQAEHRRISAALQSLAAWAAGRLAATRRQRPVCSD